jgi:ABC-type multidrug transport system ATPase subunit
MLPDVSAAVELHDVHLRRAGREVLHGVSLAIPAGRVTALLGPSGSGKSTVLRCAVRPEEPDAGTVTVEGRNVRELDPCALRRRVGLVAQTPAMLPGSVRDNLAYAAGAVPERALRAAAVRAGLEPAFLDRPSGELSGGERARVAIARALVREPAALLLDEPTAALDPARAAGIEQLARELAADGGLAVALTTHDVALARRVADTAHLLVAGRVVTHGEPGEVVRAWEAEAAGR